MIANNPVFLDFLYCLLCNKIALQKLNVPTGDATAHLLLELQVSDEELARRKAAWVRPSPRYTRGVLAKFARNASSASTGAVLDRWEG